MARTSIVAKMRKPQKFATRFRRKSLPTDAAVVAAFYRDFGLCRLCFRQSAHKGYIPGVVKSGW